ncbi:hypothetical protein [Actinosynnema mirum]|uniref:Uncharacterized protein n=1 Tax=Actinosynnema mirum (strain ATCC 29888 / DSM 43827 / JCM 3225 / NBRC 14064 / NCIMB 13271 / NRRL B-12336 / IMRU 3971 / 101) TaxID=446462 RepID=C6WQF0_ACTMD|nr:hypothetical protein [Actinosynnema mirum]ACU36804.1 hypothetical protein Amir_2876 [Actinosynnema mirum DSM 43827]
MSTEDFGRRVAGIAAVVGAIACAVAVGAPVAHAAGRVELSTSTADPDYATTIDLRGSGFQSVPNAHGGIYVLFGWVSDAGGSWRPSAGGQAGSTYRYVQDSEAKDNNGFQRFVSFPGSDTASSANGGTVSADGSWSTRLVVPGARFPAVDRAGNTTQVDCTQVRCGIITIGAHGVVNPNNETFTPITFAVPAQQQQPAPVAPRPTAPPTGQAPAPQEDRAQQPAAVLSATSGDAVVGQPVAVTGSGFAADEQVQVLLQPGALFLPVATADAAGSLSYSAVVPEGTQAGQYRLEFTGTRSRALGGVDLAVAAAAQQAATDTAARQAPGQRDNTWLLVGAGGAALVVVVVVAGVVVLRKRRRAEVGQ